MASIPSTSISSITSPNWLAEAYNNIQLAAQPDGILGALQNAKDPGSLRSFLNNSFNNSNSLALIAQDANQQISTVGARQAASIYDKAQRAAIDARLNAPPQQNFNPPAELPSMIFFGDGTTIDTQNNIMTLPNGTQIDTTTGAEYTEPGSIVNMAGGGYLNTKTNILTLPDGTKIDTVTGLTVVGQNQSTT